MKEVVIISAVRTPVGRYMGALKNIEAYDLAAMVLNSAVKRAHISPDQVDEVIMGQSSERRVCQYSQDGSFAGGMAGSYSRCNPG